MQSRTMDIDLLLYGDTVTTAGPVALPRDEIGRYAFVLRPLAELAPALRHPVSGARMDELWAGFDATGQRCERLDLDPLELPGESAQTRLDPPSMEST